MHGGRLAPLRAAAILAAAFVVLRVVYRVLFGGASGGEFRLLDLPRIPLAGPFEHITLFGPVTLGGILAAAVSALPFAAVILAFGLLNVIVDVRGLFTRGAVRGPLRTVSRAIVIAWATFPALLESVGRVRVARELRGERGAASLLVPVFEHTVERALALAASMEVRGFAAGRRLEPVCERPVVMRDAALGYAGTRILEGVGLDLDLAPGTLTLVTGPTGSGKSSLLHAMSGLFQHFSEGEQHGVIEIGGADRASTPPRETAGFVGVVPQLARLSFVAETVADELGFTLAVRGVAPVIVRDRAAEVARHLGIEHLLDRDVRAVSAGEAELVAIGAAIVSRPVLLIVDEPLAELDAAARTRVVGALDRLAHEAGVCVVVAEHHTAELEPIADARLELRGGGVHPVRPREARTDPAARPAPTEPLKPRADIRHVSVSHGETTAVDDVSLQVAGGELVALLGRNGAGKSSLLHAIARPARPGTVTIDGVDTTTLKPRARRRSVALVPEAFDDLLFTTTVEEECRRVDGAAEAFARFLGLADAPGLMARHPRDLSAGERLCLVMAIQLSARPALLLVDEPTRGLDPAARELIGAALTAVAASGTAVMIATHDREFADRFATRSITMSAGRIHTPAVLP
jgi:energy-coupling factor transport system ATP-binding protein